MAITASLDLPVLFDDYIVRNAAYALQAVQKTDATLDQAQCEMALQALHWALARDEAWCAARDLLLALAPFLERTGPRRVWLSFLESGLIRSQQAGDAQAEIAIRYHLGALLQQMARLDDAVIQFQAALTLARTGGERLWRVKLYKRLGYSLRRQRRWPEAEEMVERARALMSEEDLSEQGYACLTLGAIQLDQRQWRQARDHFRCSLQRWRQTGDERRMVWAHINLGMTAWRLHLSAQAESHFRDAIHLLEHLDDPNTLAVVNMNMGGLLGDADRADEALPYLRRAEAIFRRLNSRSRLAMVATNLGRAYYELTQWPRAVAAFEFSMTQWRELGNKARELNAVAGLAAALAQQGDAARARALVAAGMQELDALPHQEDRAFLGDALREALKIIAAKGRERD